jgi:hypothetical protein
MLVCDLRQVGGFLRVLQFPLPIKLTITIQLKVEWDTITLAPTHYFAFQCFDYDSTRRLFQKGVARSKFDIFIFMYLY